MATNKFFRRFLLQDFSTYIKKNTEVDVYWARTVIRTLTLLLIFQLKNFYLISQKKRFQLILLTSGKTFFMLCIYIKIQVCKNERISGGALDFHTRSKTLEIKSFSCTRGQRGRTVALRLVQTVKKEPSQRGAFVPNEDENAKYKESLFLH